MVLLFGVVSLLSAFLMFAVEPMVGKLVLPDYGGTAAVWNTCLLFFQASLLLGYMYAHVLRRVLVRQPLLHAAIGVAGLVLLPVALPRWAPPPTVGSPVLHLLLVLLVVVGLPFIALATTAPLVQLWFSRTGHRRSSDPYFLYAAGNVGSFLGLLCYPFVIEPRMSLQTQARVWAVGYAVVVAMTVTCGLVALRAGRTFNAVHVEDHTSTERIGWRRTLKWLLLAALPSSILLGTTSFLTTDVAAIPLLWVVPLSIYLLTFVVAFSRYGRASSAWAGLALIGLVVSYASLSGLGLSMPLRIVVMCALLACAGLAGHGRLAGDRPSTGRLTYFYLIVSVGGAIGGAFNALVAPLVFNRVVELPLAVAALLALLAALDVRDRLVRLRGLIRFPIRTALLIFAAAMPLVSHLILRSSRLSSGYAVLAVLSVTVAFAAASRLARWSRQAFAVGAALTLVPGLLIAAPVLVRERTFYGVYRVYASDAEHFLFSGSTVHGAQSIGSVEARQPQTYYTRQGPLGDVFRVYGKSALLDQVALVGLGAGSFTAYGRPGQQITIYELDPAVVRIAEDPRYFTYLRDTEAVTRVVVGDGRLRIRQAPSHTYGLIALDAFSSDSIPVHLMTREAVNLYLSKLKDGGLLAFHVTNRYLNLSEVLAGIAADEHLTALIRDDNRVDVHGERFASTWVVVARSPNDVAALRRVSGWHPLAVPRHAWTDSYSDLASVWR